MVHCPHAHRRGDQDPCAYLTTHTERARYESDVREQIQARLGGCVGVKSFRNLSFFTTSLKPTPLPQAIKETLDWCKTKPV